MMNKLSRKLGMLAIGAAMSGTALLATPKEAAAQDWWVYLDGGYAILTSNANDVWDNGFVFDLAFGKVIQDRFAVGLFGGASFHSAKSISVIGLSEFGSLTIWRYGVWGGVNAMDPANPWAVWFGGGVGLGTTSVGDSKDDQGASIPNTGGSETDFLLQGNLAVSRQVSPNVSIGANATFFIIFTEGDSLTGIPLTAYVSILP